MAARRPRGRRRRSRAVLAQAALADGRGAVGAQYYWIFHYHPVALLGWIALLEGYPPSREEIDAADGPDRLRARGVPDARAHAELDLRHRDELFERIDRLPLTRSSPQSSA